MTTTHSNLPLLHGLNQRPGEEASYTGEIVSILFTEESSGFSISRFLPEGSREPITILGTLGSPGVGSWLSVSGVWEENKKFGIQLRVTSFSVSDPQSIQGIIKFLSSECIKGVGPATARKIVDAFGPETFHVLDSDPQRLTRISGIGKRKAEKIIATWAEHRHLSAALSFLQGYGVGPATAHRIVTRYGKECEEVIRREPYRLAEEVWGIGFRTADTIALSLGISPTSERRATEALYYTLKRAVDDGHTFFPREELFTKCAELLSPHTFDFEPVLTQLVTSGRVIIEESRCYTKAMYRAEVGVAKEVRRLVSTSITQRIPPEGDLPGGLSLSSEQQKAVKSCFTEAITVITGGPGTGKTTLVKVVVSSARGLSRSIHLAAPTGRAAKRLGEASGQEAKTLHRLLEFDPKSGRFGRGKNNPLSGELFIVDEVSMVDLPLMYALMCAIPSGAKLVLVGDADQLPSVGPGRVLHSLIASGVLPVVILSTIYRQGLMSSIIRCSHEILHGEFPSHGKGESGDFFFIERDEPEAIVATVTHLVAARIPSSYGFDPLTEVQVLVPKHKGELGTRQFNTVLQSALNPAGYPFTAAGMEWRTGDKVMQIKNNYDLNVFNGDMGIIEQVNADEKEVTIRYDEQTLVRPLRDLSEMVPAYAISIHKSQGSEYPAVVLPMHTQYSIMLQRNLLYTAVTRAKSLVVIVGSRRALNLAISNNFQTPRNDTLAERLSALF